MLPHFRLSNLHFLYFQVNVACIKCDKILFLCEKYLPVFQFMQCIFVILYQYLASHKSIWLRLDFTNPQLNSWSKSSDWLCCRRVWAVRASLHHQSNAESKFWFFWLEQPWTVKCVILQDISLPVVLLYMLIINNYRGKRQDSNDKTLVLSSYTYWSRRFIINPKKWYQKTTKLFFFSTPNLLKWMSE